jgi:hypothetical protein
VAKSIKSARFELSLMTTDSPLNQTPSYEELNNTTMHNITGMALYLSKTVVFFMIHLPVSLRMLKLYHFSPTLPTGTLSRHDSILSK